MTVTIAHARLSCVCTDTEITTHYSCRVTTVKVSHHKQISISSVSRTCLYNIQLWQIDKTQPKYNIKIRLVIKYKTCQKI